MSADCLFQERFLDYDHNKFLEQLMSARHKGVKPIGGDEPICAVYRASLAVFVARMLGCRIEGVLVGRTSCAEQLCWLVTVAPHFGRCDVLAAINSDDWSHIEDRTPSLFGSPGYRAMETIDDLISLWLSDNLETMRQLVRLLGSGGYWSGADIDAAVCFPQSYDLEGDFTNRVFLAASRRDS